MIVHESLNEFKRGQSTKTALGIGYLGRAMKWLEDHQEMVYNYRAGVEIINYKFKLSPDKSEIILTGLANPYNFGRVLHPPDFVMKSLTNRMKFNIALDSYHTGNLKEYAKIAIDDGYLPPPSLFVQKWDEISKSLGPDIMIELLIKRFPGRLPSKLTFAASSIWPTNILRKYFDNSEFDNDIELAKRPIHEIDRDREKALNTLLHNDFEDVSSPRQIKNKTITVYDKDSGESWNMTKGGRLRRVNGTVGFYANDYTTFIEMANILIKHLNK